MTQPPLGNATLAAGELAANWKPDTSAFGARLALIRWQLNYNQKEAAIAAGFPPATWVAWETGGSMPRDFAAVTSQIAERTGVDRLWLMLGDEAPAVAA
jgi:transcriptional regulator with XRE-family HTH domain